jgi:hypothetical protein
MGKYVETVVKIQTEASLLDQFFKIAAGGCDDPHIAVRGVCPPTLSNSRS